MPLTIWNCVLFTNKGIISVEIGLFFQEITFITEFHGSNFLLPTFLPGGKWDFQVANLLLLILNLGSTSSLFYHPTNSFLTPLRIVKSTGSNLKIITLHVTVFIQL